MNKMNQIEHAFAKIENAFAKRKALITFITAGDPDLETTASMLKTLADSGADLIEIGIPFSDPVAEGPVIQAADERALSAGCTVDRIFDMIRQVSADINIPLVFMTYINPVFAYGKRCFLETCAEIGISGIIVPDLPFEEKDELAGLCQENQLALISMISPTSDQRVSAIASEAEGFVYCVSSLGVTGMRQQIEVNVSQMVSRVRAVSTIPCAIGFGISNAKQAASMARQADGVIIGSAIVDLIGRHGKAAHVPVATFIKSIRQSIDAIE